MATKGRGNRPYITNPRVSIRDLPAGTTIDYKITIIWPRPPSPPNPPQKIRIAGTFIWPRPPVPPPPVQRRMKVARKPRRTK